MATRLFLRQALLPTGWADNVLVSVDGEGMIESVEPGAVPPRECVRIGNTVVPGMPNCHSHAHQRAMAGLGERATLDADGGKATDSFWTWRKVMYHYLERIQPFSKLPKKELRELAGMARAAAYRAKEILFMQDWPADSAWLLYSGRVNIVSTSRCPSSTYARSRLRAASRWRMSTTAASISALVTFTRCICSACSWSSASPW